METGWGIGYYLGSSCRTTEHLIGTEHGIVKVDTFRRMPDDVAYDAACLDTVKVGYRECVRGRNINNADDQAIRSIAEEC